MGRSYFKRYRMELDLAVVRQAAPLLPRGYSLVPWSRSLLEAHAEAKYRSFCDELDAHVFPCFLHYDGCLQLMAEISLRGGFIPEATWLAIHQPAPMRPSAVCGTIQGIRDHTGVGGLQNIGVVPEHRGRGLGSCLIQQALVGFRSAGVDRVSLEVTAENYRAVNLYRRLGFRTVRTLYKTVEPAYNY